MSRKNGNPIRNQNEEVPTGENRIREGLEQVGHQFHEGIDAAREGVGQGYRQAEKVIARNPAQSVFLGFGLGFGLGLVACSLLGREEKTWAERHLPNSLAHFPDTVKHVPEQVHHLADALMSRLPESVRKHFG